MNDAVRTPTGGPARGVVRLRKLRVPREPELAIGAVDETGTIVKGHYFDIASAAYLREEVRTQGNPPQEARSASVSSVSLSPWDP